MLRTASACHFQSEEYNTGDGGTSRPLQSIIYWFLHVFIIMFDCQMTLILFQIIVNIYLRNILPSCVFLHAFCAELWLSQAHGMVTHMARSLHFSHNRSVTRNETRVIARATCSTNPPAAQWLTGCQPVVHLFSIQF